MQENSELLNYLIIMKKMFIFSVLLSGICIMLISSSFKPVVSTSASVRVTCEGPPCEDANGNIYNDFDPLLGKNVCCGIASPYRGNQQTVN
jgi:hypothetical protein